MSPTNPYIVGNPVGNSPVFVGRPDILREVLRVVRDSQDNAIVLYGQRRIGKTSVLQKLEARLPKEGLHPIFFDLQNKAEWSLGRLLRELAHKISSFLALAPPDLGDDPETTFRQVWLPDVLNNLPTNASLVLLFDEFDVLANPESEQAAAAFFPYLRDLLNTNPTHLNCVFAIGRNIDDLSSIALSLFRGVPAKHVSLLSHEETVRLIHFSQTNQTLNWSNDEAVEKIWQLTNGHPFLTQALCSHIWDRLHNKNPNEPPTVTSKDVEETIPDTLISRRNTLEWLWDGLPPAERVVASTLAGAGAKVITDIQLEELLRKSGVQIIIRELHNAPRLLQELDLIEPADGGYRFRVELLRRWIAEYKLPQQAQSELDHLDPAADTLYQACQKLYRDGHEAVAVEPLRQAIGLNSHHVGANLLLADILLKQKQAKEAREILEQLYTIRPVAAQTSLIRALLALAKSNNSDDEQLKLYQRILAIDPKHPEARGERQQILDNQNAKRQKWINTIKGIYEKLSKRMWQFLGFIFALVVSYYWLTVRIPTDPLIVLEVGQPANDVSEYTITGVVSDKPYWLDTVKILPHCDHPVKQATFKYDIYKGVDLKVNPNTQPPTYWVDKALLQQTLAEKDQPFSFEFLDKERFTFSFQFEAPETTLAEFECQVFTADNRNVPCQVREKGYLSLFRGIPWFGISSILGIILIVLIEIVYAFKKRKKGPTIIY
ncbi:MAG: hypothetical protein DRR19_06425 [Candidatus Parabeggiatoa sp. nov. 1]|nr:MAG: hypothetical protein DRR19_06425 [Gammaproteobacteria bacterium]